VVEGVLAREHPETAVREQADIELIEELAQRRLAVPRVANGADAVEHEETRRPLANGAEEEVSCLLRALPDPRIRIQEGDLVSDPFSVEKGEAGQLVHELVV
jgi:hypothetical protein